MNKKHKKLAVLPGDGIGKEVVDEALKVMNAVADKRSLHIDLSFADVGGAALDKYHIPLPDETLQLCLESDAVLLGAVGGPNWESQPHHLKPERALLKLRQELGLFANVRPAKVYAPLIHASTLKAEVIRDIDLIVMRELTGGIYFGEPRGIRQNGKEKIGTNTLVYSSSEIERIARAAFDMAGKRRKKVTSVDKANVLDSMQLWRDVVCEVAKEYPDIELNHLYVDNCAMQLVRNPGQFDIILTGNMFGDILSDEAAMLTGSIGMLPSASLGKYTAMYEPVHGSAPDIAGKGIANPIATIASVAMMLKFSFDMPGEADAIEHAISAVLDDGYRTPDLMEQGKKRASTGEMGDLIVEALTQTLES
ncbi:3-isopropylmalate dehydrogenase [candidate division KSB1 bacterium]|nr:3-isopropylmalate dehydrogenase [candidate division KSB1 bacterium]